MNVCQGDFYIIPTKLFCQNWLMFFMPLIIIWPIAIFLYKKVWGTDRGRNEMHFLPKGGWLSACLN